MFPPSYANGNKEPSSYGDVPTATQQEARSSAMVINGAGMVRMLESSTRKAVYVYGPVCFFRLSIILWL